MDLALATLALGVGILLFRRPLARGIVRFNAGTAGRNLDEDGVAFWEGAIGLVVAALGVAFVALSLR